MPNNVMIINSRQILRFFLFAFSYDDTFSEKQNTLLLNLKGVFILPMQFDVTFLSVGHQRSTFWKDLNCVAHHFWRITILTSIGTLLLFLLK
jgi:hypothetical protein